MEDVLKLAYNLQFFAEEGSEGSNGEEGNEGAGNQNTAGNNNTGKTFTQDEVNNIGAKEKNQGKNSILKLFGCADEKTAKTEAEEFKKWKEEQLSAEEKRNKEKAEYESTIKANEKRAIAAENKLTAISAGVTADSVDDALAIASLKVTEEKDLKAVFEEMKKEARYSGFFGTSGSSGTGSSADHNKGGQGGKTNIGERLAKARATSTSSTKSSFFNNN